MISGGGNFPVAKKEKQIAAWEKNAERYGYADSILNQIRYYAAVVKSDDPEALPVLKAQLDELTAMQEKMKAVNAYFRKNMTLDGCPDLLPEERKEIEELWERGSRIHAPYPVLSPDQQQCSDQAATHTHRAFGDGQDHAGRASGVHLQGKCRGYAGAVDLPRQAGRRNPHLAEKRGIPLVAAVRCMAGGSSPRQERWQPAA